MSREWTSNRICAMGSAAAVLATAVAGCGGGAPPASTAPAANAPASPSVAAAPATGAPVPAALPRSTATKWIGGIPYDVFYDRPLEVAADQTLLATAAATPGVPAAPTTLSAPAPMPAATPSTAPMPSTGPVTASAGTPGAVDWGTIAPMEILLEEVTELRNSLQTKLNTLADYNKSWETVGVDATALAAIAGVVEQHPGDVSWKPNAKIARHLASEINANAAKTGRSAFDASKAPYDNLVDLLGGNPPAGAEAEGNLPFGDYADRSVLMATIESSLNYAKSNITTEERLAQNAAEAKRKMTVLATLMSIVTTPGYESTDEAEYQGFAQTFIKAAVSGREAVDAKDITSFTNAVNEMQKTCAECHAKYAL